MPFAINTGDSSLMGLSLLRIKWRLLTDMNESMEQAKIEVWLWMSDMHRRDFFVIYKMGRLLKN